MASTSSWPSGRFLQLWDRPAERHKLVVSCRLSRQLDRALAVPAATAVRSATPAVISRQGMFIAAIVGSAAYVALGIMGFVSLEVIEWLRSPHGHRSMVAMPRIVTVIDVAIEAVRAVEPGSSANKYAARKPVRPVVAVGCAVVWSVVEVPVGAHRSHSDVDGNLRRRQACAA
jgi:hypothetical protein